MIYASSVGPLELIVLLIVVLALFVLIARVIPWIFRALFRQQTCPHCRKNIPSGASVCHRCGRTVASS